MIDPLLIRIIALGFALLFLLAAAHKLGDKSRFRASLVAYQILPPSLIGVVTHIIPVIELLVGLGWLATGLIGTDLPLVALVSAALLATYTSAMAINLARGRSYIDCGCSFTRGHATASANASQRISVGLLLRNSLLIAMALFSTLPASARELQLIDLFALCLATISLVFIYGAFNQLMMNRNAIDSWRRKHA